MSALTQSRMVVETVYKNIPLPLAASTAVYEGGIACLDTSAHVCTKGAAANANLIYVGQFLQDYDNSGSTATAFVMVSLNTEVTIRWYDSVTGGNAVTSANLFSTVYIFDDHTLTTSSSGNSSAGRLWAVDPVKGVGVVQSSST